MEQYYEYCLAAVIILIPLTSISHFIPPLPVCMLADLCNHTWIPECAQELDYDYRMFIDECDVLEYNCDYARNFTITNYSDCFGFVTCPPMPTCAACPTCKKCKARRLFDPVATVPVDKRRLQRRHNHGGHEGHDHFVEHIHLLDGYRGVGTLQPTFGTGRKPDRTPGPAIPNMRRYHLLPGRRLRDRTKTKKKYKGKNKTTKLTTSNKTTKPTKKKPKMKTRITKQVIETGTTASALYTNKYTVMKNGKKYNKVVKYIVHKVLKKTIGTGKAVEKKDSDFMEK